MWPLLVHREYQAIWEKESHVCQLIVHCSSDEN